MHNYSLQDKTISCSRNTKTIVEIVIITASMFILIHLGNFLALVGEFREFSMMENILNLIIVPLFPTLWLLTFVFHVGYAMLLALIQKMTEKLENVPEKDVEKWIIDNLTIFKKFEPKFSLFCLIFLTLA